MSEESFYDPQARFMEELILRFERAFRSVDRDIQVNTMVLRELADEIKEHRRAFREEYEAQRGTLLALLDRLGLADPREGPAPAG